MNSPLQNRSDLRHPRLQRFLYPVAQSLRKAQQLERRSKRLFPILCVSIAFAAVAFFFPGIASLAMLAIALLVCGALILSWKEESATTLDYLAAARLVESKHPELKQSLVTAVEQELEGNNSFLSRRVASKALESRSRGEWELAGKQKRKIAGIRYLGMLALALCPLIATYWLADQELSWEQEPFIQFSGGTEISVEPGDTELERGSSLVITARFPRRLPESVSLVATGDDGAEKTYAMAQSLSDPVFAFSLRSIETGASYHVRYDDQSSDSYRIEVYDLPELLQADAQLAYPEYTTWKDRDIEDTLRISAIEGTELRYSFNMNKPLQGARLESSDGRSIELEPSNEERTQFAYETKLASSETYTLRLVDSDGRENPFPPEVRIDAILNERPELKLETPRGDQRLSSLEEVLFQGSVSDDFGLLDYGIGFVVAAENQQDISLIGSAFEPRSLMEDVSYLLRLEEYELQPKDTLSWYLWADDFGPDGNVRRSTGDLYFADIRSFDEIFREQDAGGGGGQGGAANQGIELIEKQRRIAISLFRIKNSATRPEAVLEDLDIVQRSQVEALTELQQLVPQLEEASARQAAIEAQRFMEGVDIGLTNAIDTPTLDPLNTAWRDAQGAYQALVKLTEDEYNVSRAPNQMGGGGGASRNQSQLNELDFRQEDSRYETASEAQALSSPEERQDLELISKLNELSRRQSDMNERLQEMQNALAEAKTQEERERIERELKRLQEEQRDLLSQADEAIQQAGNRQSASQARQQLEQARESMQRASEQLEKGEVSQALASGTRAQDRLEQTREQMRNQNSSQFSDAMREARRRARELSESQNELQEELQSFGQEFQPRLDDSQERDSLADKIDAQSQALDQLLDEVREIAEGAEAVEPALFRKLYQVLRDTAGAEFEERYETSSLMLRQGFLNEAMDGQEGLSNELDALSEAISEAAESVLGDESSALRFAQNELESLSDQLQQERDSQEPSPRQGQASRQSQRSSQGSDPSQSGEPSQSRSQSNSESQASASNSQAGGRSGNPSRGERGQGSAPRSIEDMIRDALNEIQSTNQGPLTGGNFNEWIERLSIVESLVDEPLARARISEAREIAEDLRRDFKRHGSLPQWEIIENQVAAPLNDVSSWLESEFQRIENPDALQPVDRDPIPEGYGDFVRRYYESLGND